MRLINKAASDGDLSILPVVRLTARGASRRRGGLIGFVAIWSGGEVPRAVAQLGRPHSINQVSRNVESVDVIDATINVDNGQTIVKSAKQFVVGGRNFELVRWGDTHPRPDRQFIKTDIVWLWRNEYLSSAPTRYAYIDNQVVGWGLAGIFNTQNGANDPAFGDQFNALDKNVRPQLALSGVSSVSNETHGRVPQADSSQEKQKLARLHSINLVIVGVSSALLWLGSWLYLSGRSVLGVGIALYDFACPLFRIDPY